MQIPRFSEVLSLCYFVSLLYFENILCPFEKCFYTYQRIQLLVILTSLRLFTFFGNLPPYDYSRTLRLLILSRNSSPYAYSIHFFCFISNHSVFQPLEKFEIFEVVAQPLLNSSSKILYPAVIQPQLGFHGFRGTHGILEKGSGTHGF